MAYCTKCGEKLPDDAYFCAKCGVKTQKGVEANVPTPADELREAFTRVGVEMEKAFLVVAKEAHNAFQKAKENVQKSQQPIQCVSCQASIPPNSVYCSKCGAKQGE
ncbi:MAG: zinc ribbon domain-containing protein [Candidatus Bathyarchaeota archaeon]|nr:zinc ribbon domain-containing protein [Candidatus Bathyarchaeota archaeon]